MTVSGHNGVYKIVILNSASAHTIHVVKFDFFLRFGYRSHGESKVEWGLSTSIAQAIHYPSESVIFNDDFNNRNKTN